MPRKNLSADIQADVLLQSARRCALCYHLYGDLSVKHGQIAHVDQDPNNNDLENLAFLCLPHHSEYDSKTSQHKNFTDNELKRSRDNLYAAVNNKEHYEKIVFKEVAETKKRPPLSDSKIDELLQKALDPKQSLTPILREAAVIASEVNDIEMENWIKLELNGYVDVLTDELPYYRKIYGELRSFNAIQGWRTVQFPNAKARKMYSSAPISTAIGQLEKSLLRRKDNNGNFMFNHSPEAKQHLVSIIQYAEDVRLSIAYESLDLILDSVRNKLYEWLLKIKRSDEMRSASATI